jgi:hypothetical protein
LDFGHQPPLFQYDVHLPNWQRVLEGYGYFWEIKNAMYITGVMKKFLIKIGPHNIVQIFKDNRVIRYVLPSLIPTFVSSSCYFYPLSLLCTHPLSAYQGVDSSKVVLMPLSHVGSIKLSFFLVYPCSFHFNLFIPSFEQTECFSTLFWKLNG